jgi:hypothetical protein
MKTTSRFLSTSKSTDQRYGSDLILFKSILYQYIFFQKKEDEIRKEVAQILKEANLESITMRSVLKDVSAKFEKYDLSAKQDLIKNIVKEVGAFLLISNLLESDHTRASSAECIKSRSLTVSQN